MSDPRQNNSQGTVAVVFEQPQELSLRRFELPQAGPGQVVVAVEFSGISTGTERLLWQGQMPQFPGMGYPLVPGYESVGRIVAVGADSSRQVGERVFVPGANCFGDVKGLFGGAASRLVIDESRALALADNIAEDGTLLALAATAQHALSIQTGDDPVDLVVGHGVLGRLLARVAMANGLPAPTVWETDARRRSGAQGYRVCAPDQDERRDYRKIVDVSGDVSILDDLIARLGRGGSIVLAGFYSKPLSFIFPPAFMREISVHVAAEWQPQDLIVARQLLESGSLHVADLISHRRCASDAKAAYRSAFFDPDCLKMILDWRSIEHADTQRH